MLIDREDYIKTSARWRATCLKMSQIGRHGHLSSSLSYIDILVYLYRHWLQLHDTDDRVADKFILSKGHGCTALYVALADSGYMEKAELQTYAKPDSRLGCHPCKHALAVLETSSGSLGQGLGIASGMALAQRQKARFSTIVVLLGDGETNEGSIWESAMFIKAQQLNNIIAIVDCNDVQAVGHPPAISGFTSLAEKFASFGWYTIEINGNDFTQIHAAFEQLSQIIDQPKVILANNSMGISFMNTQDALWHYRIPSEAEYALALQELAAEPIF